MSVLNKWGFAGVTILVAVLPTGFAIAALSGGNPSSSALVPLGLMVVAASCGVIASKRGSRWWLIVPVFATLWICVVMLQIVLPE